MPKDDGFADIFSFLGIVEIVATGFIEDYPKPTLQVATVAYYIP